MSEFLTTQEILNKVFVNNTNKLNATELYSVQDYFNAVYDKDKDALRINVEGASGYWGEIITSEEQLPEASESTQGTIIPCISNKNLSFYVLTAIDESDSSSNSTNYYWQKINCGVNISFNGKEMVAGASKINFTGTVKVTDLGDGQAKVQIGENMDSSSWNLIDGKTTGTVFDVSTSSAICSDATNASFKIGNWVSGETIQAAKDSVISLTSSGNIHFNDGNNVWTITVFDDDGITELRKATITDNVSIDYESAIAGTQTGLTFTSGVVIYSIGENGITSSITNQAIEDNYPASIGARGKRTFNIDLSSILPNGGRTKIKIEGCGGVFISKDFFYCNGTLPNISSTSLMLNSMGTKIISGITYLTTGTTFDLITDTISDLNNQILSGTNKLIFSSTAISAPNALTSTSFIGMSNNSYAYDAVTTYGVSNLSLLANKSLTNVSLSINPINFYGTGNSSTGEIANILVNSYSTTAPTDLTENFYTENRRLPSNNLSGVWNSSASLIGTSELMVLPGCGLQYPSLTTTYGTADYSSFTIPSSNFNYGVENIGTGFRTYVRKFINSGATAGGSFNFGTGLSENDLNVSKIKLEVSKDGILWYDITKTNTESANGIRINKTTKVFPYIDFLFDDGGVNSGTGIFLKISLSEMFLKPITSISIVFA